jgi:uncharacterized protein (TIGR02246 family)
MDVAEWVERYGRAWEQADADAVVELFVEDASYRSFIFDEAHVGRDAIRAYWQRATGTQSEARVRMGRPLVDGRHVAVEWWTTLREPDVGAITLPGCLLLRFSAEGLCESLHEYWLQTAGTQEPPPEWGSHGG